MVAKLMDKIFEQSLLYDFYGELLTEHQRQIYEAAVFEDLSLGEIAEQYSISRQGVHDLLKRCDQMLLHYEEKLQLVERFLRAKQSAGALLSWADDHADAFSASMRKEFDTHMRELMDQF